MFEMYVVYSIMQSKVFLMKVNRLSTAGPRKIIRVNSSLPLIKILLRWDTNPYAVTLAEISKSSPKELIVEFS